MSKLTSLDIIKLEIELDGLKRDKMLAMEAHDYERAANIRNREKEISEILNGKSLNTTRVEHDIPDRIIRGHQGCPTLEWDYKGYKKADPTKFKYNQLDWNQTLITKINQISATLHKNLFRGGANVILVHETMIPLIKNNEYTNESAEGVLTLAHRYRVFVDNRLDPDTIQLVSYRPKDIVGNVSTDDNFCVCIPKFTTNSEGVQEMALVVTSNEKDKEAVDEYFGRLNGFIKVENFTYEDSLNEAKYNDKSVEIETLSANELIDRLKLSRVVLEDNNPIEYKSYNSSGRMHEAPKIEGTHVSATELFDAIVKYDNTLPIGMVFYFQHNPSYDTKFIQKGEYVMGAMTINKRDRINTIQKMEELMSKPTFYKWAGINKPIMGTDVFGNALSNDAKGIIGIDEILRYE